MERLRKARDSMIPLLEAGRADGLGCRGLAAQEVKLGCCQNNMDVQPLTGFC